MGAEPKLVPDIAAFSGRDEEPVTDELGALTW